MRVLGVAAAGSAALLLAACSGGGDDNAGETASTLAADQFRRQADAICRKYENELDELATPSSMDELQRFVADALRLVEQGRMELDSLTPPGELRADWDEAMKLQDQSVDAMHDLEEAVGRNDLAAVSTITKSLDDNQAESERVARKLGLHDCGKPQTSTITTG
jgi:hypothetical protein